MVGKERRTQASEIPAGRALIPAILYYFCVWAYCSLMKNMQSARSWSWHRPCIPVLTGLMTASTLLTAVNLSQCDCRLSTKNRRELKYLNMKYNTWWFVWIQVSFIPLFPGTLQKTLQSIRKIANGSHYILWTLMETGLVVCAMFL